MTALLGLESVKRALQAKSYSIEQIYSEYALLWQQMEWDASQIRLWLACLPGIRLATDLDGSVAYQLDRSATSNDNNLADELVALLSNAGRPMPLAQLMCKLPAGLVATEPMLRAAAQKDSRLELKGPLVKLA